jgi:hypothetical protein
MAEARQHHNQSRMQATVIIARWVVARFSSGVST